MSPSELVKEVEAFLKREELQYESIESEDPEFSWSPCECCGSALGGDRHTLIGLSKDEIYRYKICTDCALYIATGEVSEE